MDGAVGVRKGWPAGVLEYQLKYTEEQIQPAVSNHISTDPRNRETRKGPVSKTPDSFFFLSSE
jgi:hypothetical protein